MWDLGEEEIWGEGGKEWAVMLIFLVLGCSASQLSLLKSDVSGYPCQLAGEPLRHSRPSNPNPGLQLR